MVTLSAWKLGYAVLVLWVAAVIASPAQTFTSLTSFNYTDGAIPFGLIQGSDGNLWGGTDKGGTGGNFSCNTSCGTIFNVTPAGVLTSVHGFNGNDGNGPTAVIQASNGTYYGTASYGGTHDCTSFGSPGPCGNVFKLVGTTLTPIYNFCAQNNCTDGAIPWGRMVQGTDGNLYGTTQAGGTGTCSGALGPGCGTVFKITVATGALKTLHSFVNTDGAYPFGWLIQASDGNFYGTTPVGGANGYGTVFKITSAGTLTTVHNFAKTDGAYPYGGLVQAANGTFYGTTSELELNGAPDCTLTGVGYGTVFEMTSAGKVTTLHSFANTDGAYPYTGLVQGTDGNFYGSTACGGTHNDGTAFSVTSLGTLKTLHIFAGSDGSIPLSGLTQHTNGEFYGTTVFGGTDNDGTVFRLSVALGPFLQIQPTSGKEGAKIGIAGQGFSSSSVVKFGGTKATTIVLTGTTFITATVPAAALTGAVTVTTGTTTLTSTKTFKVLPTITSFSPPSGPVGTLVTITGTGLEQTTKVTFAGKSTTFTVVKDTEVTADVPTGAVTGKIAVTTKGGSASSATSFTVN